MKHLMRSPGAWRRLGLLVLSAAALTLAMAPRRQFYLAWVGLVPWLIVVAQAPTARKAFAWGALGAAIFFAANLWPIALLTVSGAVFLTIFLAATWGFAAAAAHRCRLLGVFDPEHHQHRPGARKLFARIAAIACVFVTAEWLRDRVIIEFPLLQLAHTQTGVLPICQIADVGGTAAVTFLLVAINACVALFVQRPRWRRSKILASIVWLAIVIFVVLYGSSRMDEEGEGG